MSNTANASGAGYEVHDVSLCEYDPISGDRIGEFIRRWIVDGDGNSIGVSVDLELDGSTPYTFTGGSLTRTCQNEVDCDNDPCVMGLNRTVAVDPAVNSPTVFNGTGFASFQFDNPPTGVGSTRYKVDIFDGFSPNSGYDLVVDSSNVFRSGRLMEWLTSGPGGVRPPSDEIFVVRDIIGGPGGGAVGLAPATPIFQATPVAWAIPGWAVEAEGNGWDNFSTNAPFLNLTVDLNIQNPQRCDLSAIDYDPVNDPGVSIQDLLDNFQAVIDDHFTVAVDPNRAFEVGLSGAADVDIYKFGAGNPTVSDSVVLCQTVLDNVVCFSGEDEPLQSITALNPAGQVVFGPFYRRIDDGAFVEPLGDPISCDAAALARYETQCGSCLSSLTSSPYNGVGTGGNFQMGQTNRAPGKIIMRIVEAGGSPINVATQICTWYNTPGNERSVFVLPSVNGGVWAGRPVVIPHWAVVFMDCSTPGTVAFSMLPGALDHPDDCLITADPTLGNLWANFVAAQTQQFNVTGHPLNNFTANFGNYNIFDLSTSGGPALRVQTCDPTVDGGFAMCDTLTDGSVILFRRSIIVDVDGNVTVTDTLYDGTTYVPSGTVAPSDSLCAVTDPDMCVVGEACVGQAVPGFPHGSPNDPGNGWDFATNPSNGVYTGVTILSIDNAPMVDAFMSCVWDGAAVTPETIAIVNEFNGIFGTAGLVIGGVGLTNVVQNGPGDWTFDIDMPASLADFQANCPAFLATTATLDLNGTPVTQTVAAWYNQFIFGQFVLSGFLNAFLPATDFVCVSQTTVDVERMALITTPCDPVPCITDCDYTRFVTQANPTNTPATPFTFDVDDYDVVGDSAFSLIFDFTNEPTWITAIQDWLTAGIKTGDMIFISGTWNGVTGTSTDIILGEWSFMTDPYIVGNLVTFTLDSTRKAPCEQGLVDIGAGPIPFGIQDKTERFFDQIADEFEVGGGNPFTPVPIQADQGPLFIFGPASTGQATRTVVCNTVETNETAVDVHPGIRQFTSQGDFDLGFLGASSISVEVLSGVVTLDGVALSVGKTYSFSIDGTRGKIHTTTNQPFNLNTSAGDAIVFYTRSH